MVSTSAAPAARSASSAPSEGSAAPPASSASSDPVDDAAFEKAIARGRAATHAHDLARAIQAFDEALAVKRWNAQALGERGYAKLLAKDLAGAQDDLEDAGAIATDASQRSQAFFNLGLLHDKKREPQAARSAYAASARLVANPAAAAKLAGQSTCPATWTLTKPAGVTALDIARASSDSAIAAPKTETEAAAALGLGKDVPWIEIASQPMGMMTMRFEYIVRTAAGPYIEVYGQHSNARHPGRDFDLDCSASFDDGVMTVRRTRRAWYTDDPLAASAHREEFEPFSTAELPSWDFLDAKTGRQLTVVARLAGVAAVVSGRDVVVSGEGCDERISFDKPR